MENFYALLFIGLICISGVISADADCPLSNKMTSCSPKCKDDSECHGKKCCPNICNARSCVPDHLKYATAGGDGYKQNSKTATGTYCGNVKCSSFEKCEFDRASKRSKCVRQ
ncbi:uncharacterized protein LOC126734336 [Anthonomus grandis grandis]|uniref:uncharacterized protein LOC126734336 n=1 Tax=Anthonomus grandis grandis TaxID=2921223 RepID=UPI0021652612|nr:uncharacterized protein LOC126734336 [Anthonomus grandis grandis]